MTDTKTAEEYGLHHEHVSAMYFEAALGQDFEAAVARGVPDDSEHRAQFARLQREVADIKAKPGAVLWGFSTD
jgi:hypothetical protein